MNRNDRRARKMRREDTFYRDYISHLPRIPLNAPLERGRLYHMVIHHDDWCAFYDDKECNCNPIVTRHIEPKRS